MKIINLNNYEAYLLDFYEGNLNEELVLELKKFAQSHPELGIDFDEVPLPKLEPLKSEFDLKTSLKKTTQAIEDENIISFLEGLLTEIELKDFEKDLKTNNEVKQLIEKYKQTYFSKDLEILKLDKNLLYVQDFFSNQKRTFDYMEGNLADIDKLSFEDQLFENLFIQKQLKAYLATKLIPENEILNKQFLYKSEEDLILSSKAIMVLEGSLAEKKLTNLEKEELKAYQKTISKPDVNVRYPFKEELKKHPTKVFSLFGNTKYWSAAATLVVSLTLLVLFLKNSDSRGRVSQKIILKNDVYTKHYNNEKLTNQPTKLALAKSNSKNQIQLNFKNSKKANQSLANDSTLFSALNKSALANHTVQPAVNTKIDSTISVPNSTNVTPNLSDEKTETILVLKEEFENDSETEDIKTPGLNTKKSGFWSKAVKLANNLNGLGIKSLKAKDINNEYSIAFNSFGIEKK